MTQSKLEPVNLGSVARGALLEYFNKNMQLIADNIADTDTPATATRELTIRIRLKPDLERRGIEVVTSASCKLAAVAEHKSRLWTGKDAHGSAYLFDRDPRQEMLFEPPAREDNLLGFAHPAQA